MQLYHRDPAIRISPCLEYSRSVIGITKKSQFFHDQKAIVPENFMKIYRLFLELSCERTNKRTNKRHRSHNLIGGCQLRNLQVHSLSGLAAKYSWPEFAGL